jgi:hypothetical protein
MMGVRIVADPAGRGDPNEFGTPLQRRASCASRPKTDGTGFRVFLARFGSQEIKLGACRNRAMSVQSPCIICRSRAACHAHPKLGCTPIEVECSSLYEAAPPFKRPEQLVTHIKTIDPRQKLGTASAALKYDLFLDSLAKTLRAWSIGSP